MYETQESYHKYSSILSELTPSSFIFDDEKANKQEVPKNFCT